MKARTLADLLAHRPLLTRQDLCARFNISYRTLSYWVACGVFPQPKYIHGPRWIPSEIERYEQTGGGSLPKLKPFRAARKNNHEKFTQPGAIPPGPGGGAASA